MSAKSHGGGAETAVLDRVFGALADPTRRGILRQLTRGPAAVGDLAEPFDMSFAAVSKHLRVLEDAGLVTRTRDARYRPAQLDAAPLRIAAAWLGGYEQYWSDSLDAMGAHLARMSASSERTTP